LYILTFMLLHNYVCIHQIKLVSHFSWQFIIFNWIVELVKDFQPTLQFQTTWNKYMNILLHTVHCEE
jgi:hypothetical protein